MTAINPTTDATAAGQSSAAGHLPAGDGPLGEAWQHLLEHHRALTAHPLASLFDEDPDRFARFSREGAGLLLDFSKVLMTGETLDRLFRPRPRRRGGGTPRGDVLRRRHQRDRASRRAAHGPSQCHGRAGGDRRRRRDAPDRRGSHAHEGVCRGCARGAGALPHRRALHRCRQYRHRRLGSRPRHGDGGARPLPRRPAPAFRLQHRRGTSRRHGEGSRSAHDPVPDRLEDLHHRRDDDQRRFRPPVDRGEPRRRRGEGPLRRHFHRARQGRRVRHRQRPGVRLLGLGGRTLFAVVGHRPAADDRHRPGEICGIPDGRARDGRAFPHSAACRQPARAARPLSACFTATSAAIPPARSCPTTSACGSFPTTSSSSTWRATASA